MTMVLRWLTGLVFVLLLGAGAQAATKETKTELPPGMTQQQFDALADAIGQSVLRQLKEGGVVQASPEPAQAGEASDHVARFGERAKEVLAAFPLIFTNAARLGLLLDKSASGGHGVWIYGLILLASVALALAAEQGVHRLLRPYRERILVGGAQLPLGQIGLLALLDLAALAAVGLAAYLAIGAWFPGSDGQGRLAAAVLDGVVVWRAYAFLFRVFLRPDSDQARIVPLSAREASVLQRDLLVAVLIMLVARTWVRLLVAIGTPPDAVSCMMIINGFAVVGALFAVVWRSRKAMADWFMWLADGTGITREFQHGLARNWLALALPLLGAMWVAQVYGAVTGRVGVGQGISLSLNVLVAFLLFESLLDYLQRHPTLAAREAAEAPARATMRDVVLRCLRMAIVIAAFITVVETWVVDVLGLVDSRAWADLASASVIAGVILFVAYVAWQVVDVLTAKNPVAVGPAGAAAPPEDGHEEVATGASRLRTLTPLLRIALFIVIVLVSTLLVLSELGVNITPLIAGASVFGLAISFGSQTLVRDIVSGIFYLADDAFRVGEYIDCGKAKGTVEGFTLRSIRLRHQSGQVHTIPFGQLGQITNFSRDWATVKFNLRFDRDVDLEKLRKVVKKIGSEMAEDPEFKDDILQPLKMQGVADIQDSAMVMRFKFTVRPNRPSYIQREAVKRMVRAFRDAGIEFASGTVAVQAVGGGYDPAQAAAAAKAQADAAAAQQAAAMARG
jgi:moderate conductance mechanosensitive channel